LHEDVDVGIKYQKVVTGIEWAGESKDILVATLKPSEKIRYPKNAKN